MRSEHAAEEARYDVIHDGVKSYGPAFGRGAGPGDEHKHHWERHLTSEPFVCRCGAVLEGIYTPPLPEGAIEAARAERDESQIALPHGFEWARIQPPVYGYLVSHLDCGDSERVATPALVNAWPEAHTCGDAPDTGLKAFAGSIQ